MKKKFFSLFLAAALFVFPLSAAASGADLSGMQEKQAPKGVSEGKTEITIYHTNDTHGYLTEDLENGQIGIARVAGLKELDPEAVLVDAGDAIQGLPVASLTQGKDVIALMNLAGYDLMAAGNHEFDFGTEVFLERVKQAAFPILSANVYRDGELLLKGQSKGGDGCHVILERKGKKIGFFGLTTVQTASATNPEGIKGLTFEDEVETAMEEIDALQAEGADAIVAVCHMGNADASCTAPELAETLPDAYAKELDLIIDGHSHTVEQEVVDGITIVQTGSNLTAVGEVTLTIEEDETVEVASRLLTSEDFKDVAPSQQVKDELDCISKSQEALLAEEIGKLDTTLWAGWIGNIPPTRLVETNYGNLAADAYLAAGKALVAGQGTAEEKQMPVIAVENGGGIREAVKNGTITQGDLLSGFPFSNTLYMKKITPQILYEMMEQSASMLDGQDPQTGMLLQTSVSGGFLQIGGFRVVYDPDGEAGKRVISVTLDGSGEVLDRTDAKTQILLVSNNYIMSGGNDYTMLADLPKYGEAGGELETIQAYLAQCLEKQTMEQYAGTRGRIIFTGRTYRPKDYEVTIRILEEDNTPAIGRELSYRVDGGSRVNGKTDENGLLHITVSDGGHGIRLSDAMPEIYVNNYSGLGIVEDELRGLPELTFLTDGSCDPVKEQIDDPKPEPEDPPKEENPNSQIDPDGQEEAPEKLEPAKTGNEDRRVIWLAVAGAALISGIWLYSRQKQAAKNKQ